MELGLGFGLALVLGDALSGGLYGAEGGSEVAAYNPFGAAKRGGDLLSG